MAVNSVDPGKVFEDVEITYAVQSKHETGLFFMTCHRPAGYGLDGNSVPAVFSASEIVEAETFMNRMRDEFPRTTYRMVRRMTLTEVMYT